MRKALEKFVEHYKELRSVGINEDILVAYLKFKTGLAMKTIKDILQAQDEFYEKLIVEAVEDAL